MFMKGNLLFLLPLIANIQASPFELTEAYIESFSQGLQELKKISEEYEYQEENFVAEMYDSKQSLTDAKEYDFIIIGSGPSGSVIANRLSEIPEWKVLLLEAGAPETKISQVPSMYHYLQTTHYDWRYSTVSQNHSCLGMEEHRCSIAAGKALGGNTAVNDMLYGRGNQRDYDLWADLGLPEWCWNDVLPYFKKIEDAHISDFDRKHHNLGIGPKEELEQLHITPVADLRVGKNLKDQVGFIGLNFILNETSKVHGESEFLMEYLKNGKGPLTSAGIEAVGFLKTDASKEQAHYPDIELLISNNIYNRGHQIQKSLRVRKEIYDAVWAPLEPAEGFSIQVILLHPKSTGALTLHDSDPLHHPLINTNSLTDLDDRDVESLLAGIKLSLKLSHTDALQKLGIHLNHNKVPGCEHYEGDNYWKCAIKYLSVNLGQISGTAKMGPVTDKEAVVDEKLRVYGVHKLRVADASVIPVTISSNLMAPCIMIGEKAADLIKETWK
nr:glucose dehydrogenase [FAD, quinone]-like isoform X3 [Leptinotarsa decemlineata]